MSEEQESLRGILRGIAVSIDVHSQPDYLVNKSWPELLAATSDHGQRLLGEGKGGNEKTIAITIALPEDFKSVIDVEIKNPNSTIYFREIKLILTADAIEKFLSVSNSVDPSTLPKSHDDNIIINNNNNKKIEFLRKKGAPMLPDGRLMCFNDENGFSLPILIENSSIDTSATFSKVNDKIVASITRTIKIEKVKKDDEIEIDLRIKEKESSYFDTLRVKTKLN